MRAPASGLIRVWNRLEQVVVGLLGLCALGVGLFQVVGRYLFPSFNSGWGDEVIVYLVVWAVMIVSSELVRTDGHVRPDLVLRLMRPGAQRWLEAANCVVAVVFSAGLVWYGWEIVDTAWLLDERSFTGLSFPMYIYYAALPAGGVLLTFRYLVRLWRYLFRYDPATMAVGHIAAHEGLADPQAPPQD